MKKKDNECVSDSIMDKISNIPDDRLITSSRIWMEVSDVMSKNVVTISPDATVTSAARLMSNHGISCVVVTDNASVVGILTETDILKEFTSREKRGHKAKVGEIMSFPVVSAASDLSVYKASRIIEAKHLKQLPILDENRLAGIVTQTDLNRALTSYGMWKNVINVMSNDVAAIDIKSSVAETLKVMISRSVSCVIVLQGDNPIGIFTKKDFMKNVVAPRKNPNRMRIKDAMSSPAITIPYDCSVFSASMIMEKMNIRRLIVIRDKKLYGVLTQTDVFMAVKRKLEEEEEKNLRLLEDSENSVYTLDLDGKINYVNPAFMKLLDVFDPAELIEQPFLPERFWFNPDDRKQFRTELKKHDIEARELILKTSGGKKVYANLLCTFTRNVHGEINGNQGMLSNITERKEAECQLAILNKELKATIERLTLSNLELQDFAKVLAHDLKTPVHAISSLADWISVDCADKLDEHDKEQLFLLVDKANRMDETMNAILKYCGIGRFQEEKEGEEVSLNDIVAQVSQDLQPLDNIVITVENDLPHMVGEKARISQVFQNLLSNAIKYMDKPEGQIKVGCIEEGNCWKLYVADNGPGIEPKYSEKIFEVFQTLRPHDKTETSGMGLALVKKIVEMYEGEIWVESELNKGSTFFFTVPKRHFAVSEQNELICDFCEAKVKHG